MGIRKSIAKGLHGELSSGQRAFWHVLIDRRVDDIGKVQGVVTAPMPTNMSASNPWWGTVNTTVNTNSYTTNTITLPATKTGTASITINANTPLSITTSSATTSVQYTGTTLQYTGTSNMLTSGYVWAPYIPVMNTFIYDSWDNLIRVREGLLEFTLFQAINPSAKTSASSSTKSELSLYIENVTDKMTLSKRMEDARLGLLIPDIITEKDEVRLSKNVDSSEFFCGWKVYECNFDGNSLFSPEKKSIQKSYNQNPDMPYEVYKAITAMKREIGDMLDRDYAFKNNGNK
jgi:hypothetical protein